MRTHIHCPTVVGESVLRQDEDTMAVVGPREPRETLRPFPKPANLHTAIGGHVTAVAPGPLHAFSDALTS